MNPETWQQVKALFYAALEHEPQERALFLREACAGDDELRAQVASLIASHEEAGDFINEPAFISAEACFSQLNEPALIGERIGSYEIVRELGRGGMGTVYLGERADSQFEKHVAIKIIKRGMDTDFVLRRFMLERRVLASLDHPNIARLLEGGATEDGLPYFIMEYVEGRPMTAYADERRLTVSERLRLFRKVCAAVQYAHQNLIIHRDLKPSNVLVTADGTPKLLDFGVAKLLNPELTVETVDHTATMLRLMTPEYASPEQVRGLQVTTASDIYSLGVLLYELLTSHRPYRLQSRARDEIVRAVCEQEPERPSVAISRIEELPATDKAPMRATLSPARIATTRDAQPERLRRQLSGDLDNIVLKCLRKEPQRRYSSAEQFSEDIRRHLDGLPVTARQDTFTYRASKFLKRHKAGVAAASLALFAIIVGAAATAWQAHVARSERARAEFERGRAERRFQDVRKLANSFLFEFHDSIKDLQGATPARKLVVIRALEYLDSLAQEASGDSSLQRELATAYVRVGDVQGNPLLSNIGDPAGALESFRKSLTIRQALAVQRPTDATAERELAESYSRVGLLAPPQEGLEMYRKALGILEPLAAADQTNAPLRRVLAMTYENVAQLLGNPFDVNVGDTANALDYYRKALAIREDLFQHDPMMEGIRSELFDSYHYVADMLFEEGRFDEALWYQRKAQPVLEELIAANPTNAEAQRSLTVGEGRICKTLEAMGQFAEALDICDKSFASNQRLTAADPQNAFVLRQNVSGYNQVGALLAKTGNLTKALDYHRRAIDGSLKLLALDPIYADTRMRLANSYEGLGNALLLNNDLSGAAQNCRKALAIREDLVAKNPDDARFRRQLATNYNSLGAIMAKEGDAVEALENYRQALSMLGPLAATNKLNYAINHELAENYFKAGEVQAQMAAKAKRTAADRAEAWREARSSYAHSMEIYQALYNRNQSPKQLAHEIDDVARGLAKCDAVLARK